MKVQEKNQDRRAEVHVLVRESVQELREYGEYVDPIDKAICCYVAVEEGNIVHLVSKFHGTTLAVAQDLYVDGVLRKPFNTVSKSVKVQKGVKMDSDKVLCQVEDEEGEEMVVLDTTMKIVPVSGVKLSQGEGRETVGTIEVHIYVLRTFGADHPLPSGVVTYLDDEDDDEGEEGEGAEKVEKKATYATIEPEYMMEFEKNCQSLDNKSVNAFKKKLVAKRPSKEPWAIFRFHYRSKEAIEAQGLKLTYDTKKKNKAEVHELDLEPVPDLPLGATPAKPDDGGSTRASSIPPTPPPLSPTLQKRTLSNEGEAHKEDAPSDYTVEAEPAKVAESTPATPAAPMAPPVPLEPPSLKRPAAPAPILVAPEPKRQKNLSLAEIRKQLKIAKARREQNAKKRVEIDEQLAPYQAAMQAEHERLQKELEAEQRAWRDEQQALRDDAALLEEFKKAEHGE